MIGWIGDRIDALLGRGRHSTAVPVMDGPLQPNRMLDEAGVLFRQPDLDNLVADGGRIWFSAGNVLFRKDAGAEPKEVERFIGPITALSVAGGRMAIAVEDRGILLRGEGEQVIASLGGQPANCVTALALSHRDELLVAQGAQGSKAAGWKRDLMTLGCSGSVWRIEGAGRQVCLARNLAWPAGVMEEAGGSVIVSEAWRHQLVRLGGNAAPEVVLADLPGYPSRLLSTQHGPLLVVFAARNPLHEFVLREKAFRVRMVAEVPEEYWLAPALSSGRSPKEPLQLGGVKQMGVMKPWAPPRSYGLVVGLREDMQPVFSLHSRADGQMHGVTSLAICDGQLVVGAMGGGAALALPLVSLEQEDRT